METWHKEVTIPARCCPTITSARTVLRWLEASANPLATRHSMAITRILKRRCTYSRHVITIQVTADFLRETRLVTRAELIAMLTSTINLFHRLIRQARFLHGLT